MKKYIVVTLICILVTSGFFYYRYVSDNNKRSPRPVLDIKRNTDTDNLECVKLYQQNNKVTECLERLQFIDYSTSTKGDLFAGLSTVRTQFSDGDYDYVILRKRITNHDKVMAVSYESFDEDMMTGPGTPYVYDFGNSYLYLEIKRTTYGLSLMSYENFRSASSSAVSVQMFKNEKEDLLLFKKTSTTSVEIYKTSPEGFVVTHKYSLPEGMKDAGYILGSRCTGDPCNDGELTIKSFDGGIVTFNTHRFADVSYICPLVYKGVENDPFWKNGNINDTCSQVTVLTEGEDISSSYGSTEGEDVKSVLVDSQGKTKTVVLANRLITGRTVKLKIK